MVMVRRTTTEESTLVPVCRLGPNLLEVGVERALMKCLTLVRDMYHALFQHVYQPDRKEGRSGCWLKRRPPDLDFMIGRKKKPNDTKRTEKNVRGWG
jgi:hypothetical protein